jgi:DHA1 family bicyclomycin/chloramphenicol resistance-like MFS transporter
MAPFGYNAGSASALMGFIQMSIGALMSATVSILHDGTSLPMTGVMAGCSISASLLYTVGRKIVINRASAILVEEEDVEMISTL